jgi:uncharacterized protein
MIRTVICFLTIWVAPLSWGDSFSRGLVAAQAGNYPSALQEWLPLADEGDATAQFYVGRLYAIGVANLPPDCEKGVDYLKKAADQGHSKAKEYLDRIKNVDQPSPEVACEFEKRGLERAVVDLFNWISTSLFPASTKASEYDLDGLRMMAEMFQVPDFYNELGKRYAVGKEVMQDYVKAHCWFNLASAQGHPEAAKNRDDLANRMTAADVSTAQQLARESLGNGQLKCGGA